MGVAVIFQPADTGKLVQMLMGLMGQPGQVGVGLAPYGTGEGMRGVDVPRSEMTIVQPPPIVPPPPIQPPPPLPPPEPILPPPPPPPAPIPPPPPPEPEPPPPIFWTDPTGQWIIDPVTLKRIRPVPAGWTGGGFNNILGGIGGGGGLLGGGGGGGVVPGGGGTSGGEGISGSRGASGGEGGFIWTDPRGRPIDPLRLR